MRRWRFGRRPASSRCREPAATGRARFFRTAMGPPSDVRKVLPLEVAGESIHPVVLDMGNPQCVILGPLPDEPVFRRVGAALERHAMFPEGTNVEFADVETPDRVRILIWERGVGPTVVVGHRFVRRPGGGGFVRRRRARGGRRRAGRSPAGRMASRRRLPHRLGGSAGRRRVAPADSAYRAEANRLSDSDGRDSALALGGGGRGRFQVARSRRSARYLRRRRRPAPPCSRRVAKAARASCTVPVGIGYRCPHGGRRYGRAGAAPRLISTGSASPPRPTRRA